MKLAQVEDYVRTVRKPTSVVVVLNPAAGRGRTTRERLERLLNAAAGPPGASGTQHAASVRAGSSPVRWRVVESACAGGGEAAAREAVADGADVVAAAGGDGTCGEVANAIVGTGARLAVLPTGTGNDFARMLGIGTDLDLAVRTLFEGEPQRIDLGRCGDRLFVNVAGCGFDAVVAERVNRTRRGPLRLSGAAAYLLAVLQSLATYRPAKMRLTIDGQVRETRAMLCCVANARSYGGGMLIAPEARLDDGLLDVCILADAGRVEFLRALPRVFSGRHVDHPKVTMLRCRSLRLESDPPLPVLVDGEVSSASPAEFEVFHGAIEVMMPRS